jgi:hypothetical protein
MSSVANPIAPGADPRLRSLHNRVFNVLGMAGGALVAALIAVAAPGWPVRVVAALAALALAGWAVRGARVGVVCAPEHLVVRELTRTRRVPWGDVLDVSVRSVPRFKIFAPELHVAVADPGPSGGRLSVMSLADKQRPVVERRVATLTDTWQARVADSAR